MISPTGDDSNNPNVGLNPDIGVAGLGLGGINNNSPTFAGKIFISAAFPELSPTGTMTLTDLGNGAPAVASYRPFDVPSGTDPNRFNFRAFTPAIPADGKVDDLRDWAIQGIRRCSPDLRRHVVHALQTEERSGGLSVQHGGGRCAGITVQPVSHR